MKNLNGCFCGCGEEVKPGNKYIRGHHRRGQKFSEEHKAKLSIAKSGDNCSEETRRKMSLAKSGENHPLFGKHRSEETKAKISVANGGENCSEETRRKKSIANIGKHLSEETKAKISITSTGHFVSEETKAKISVAISGGNNPNFGKRRSEETRAKLEGEKCNWWQGGIKNIPYGPGNTEELKEKIRIRDNYTCQECGRVWNGKEKKFHPHHINHSKTNHIMWNRITLCNSCHPKTNNNRKYWMERLYEKNFKVCVQRILNS